MTVTIIGENKTIGVFKKYEGVDYSTVEIKDIKKKNGAEYTDVRIANGKRTKVISTAVFKTVTVQDEETGRYLFKHER